MRRCAAIIAAVTLLASLAFLFLKAREFSDKEHERFLTALWRLKHLDTAFNEDVLEARFGLLNNYDDFQAYAEELKRLVDGLGKTPAFIGPNGCVAIERARAEYTALMQDRQKLFERFKSQNAIVSNSRRYLPVALDELAARLGSHPVNDNRELESAVANLARLILMRLSTPDELPGQAQAQLEWLKDWCERDPKHREARFVSSLVRHAQTIIKGHSELDSLTRRLLALPSEATIQELFHAYEGDVAQALRRAQQYRLLLCALGVILLLGLAYSLWALRAANRHLERRVEERTRELARSEERFRILCVASPVGIYMADALGRTVYANPAWEKISDLTLEQTVGGRWIDILHPEDRDGVLSEWAAATKSGRRYMREFRLLRRGSDVRWVSSQAAPILAGDGTPSGFVGTVEDITERKQAEAKLEEAHKQLMETSRQAGMAEVATGVLHNVGNVLNSVNVSATLVAGNINKSKVCNLRKIVVLLQENSADLGAFITSDPKGKQLPAYLAQLAEHLGREQQSAIVELESLRRNIEHIKDIVAMQQNYAKVSGVAETVKVMELVEDALRMNSGALSRHEVQVVREFGESLPEITVDRHKVLQILVNLIRNAKYACDESGRHDKQMILRAVNGEGRIKISVADNGVGIPRENLTRIFNHGFTTRKDGHGFGLHSGALAAREMGGALNVHSDGPGLGACFTIDLPVQHNRTNT